VVFPESIIQLIEKSFFWINGFIMAGVILILIGVKNITQGEMRNYKLSHHNLHKIDEIVAWGIFYIIFGLLIATGGFISIHPYLK